MAIEVRAAGCCGYGINRCDCEGCARNEEIHAQAASIWGIALELCIRKAGRR